MNLFFDLFPYLIFFIVILSLWGLYDQYQFTRFEGPLKRGLMLWAEPISWETRQFLETMPPSLRFDRSFIRRENNEVLIVEKQSFWNSFFSRRRNSWRYVGYASLSGPEQQLEFRVAFSALASLTLGLMIFMVIFAGFALGFFQGEQRLPFFFWGFPLIFLSILIGSTIFDHYRARQRLLDFLKRAMRESNL